MIDAVHTTGVNFEALLATSLSVTVSVVVVLGGVYTAYHRLFDSGRDANLDKRIDDRISPVINELRAGFENLTESLTSLKMDASYHRGYLAAQENEQRKRDADE